MQREKNNKISNINHSPYERLVARLHLVINSIIDSYKSRSFGFAFWGVFVFGSIFIGFFSRVYNLVTNFVHIPNGILFPPGYLSLWGYINISYLIFSTIYLYQKSKLLTRKSCMQVRLLLVIYVVSCVFMIKFTIFSSLLYLLGSLIYDFATGGDLVMNFLSKLWEYYT